jgi:PLP dependent protein
MTSISGFSTRFDDLNAQISTAQTGHPLAATRVTLVGASKQQPEAVLREALAYGLRHFGENRVQEAQSKWPALREIYPDMQLRLIGPLQSNKAADAVALFDVIETLDRPKLALALAETMQKQRRHLPVLLQVNTGEEVQKAGIAPREVEALYRFATEECGLKVVGLMAVPPAEQAPAPHFALVRTLADGLGLRELSMGMSGDFATAIAFGATHVRLGTALFGSRN